MKYLKRLTYYCNRVQAQADYAALAAQVTSAGHPELAEKYKPGDNATLAQIDAAIADLRAEAQPNVNPYVMPTD